MKYLLTLFCSLLSIFSAEAQSFRLIPVDREVNFRLNDTLSFYIRQDSVELVGSDSIIYLNSRIGPPTALASSCLYSVLDTGFLGPKMLIKADRTQVFFNQYGDSIFIKPEADFSDIWRVYTYPDGSYIEASGWFNSFGDVLPSYTDTVKRVKFFAYTPTGVNDLLNPFNDTLISYGGNSGWLQVFDWHHFPDGMDYYLLDGIKNPETVTDGAGKNQNINARDIFDYREGNELHFLATSQFNDVGPSFTEKEYTKLFALTRSDSPDGDTVIVNWSRGMLSQEFENGNLIFETVVLDTIETRTALNNYALLDVFEMEYSPWMYENDMDDYELHGFTDQSRDSAAFFNRRQKTVHADLLYNSSEPCLEDDVLANFTLEATYLDGIGPFYQDDFTVFSGGVDVRETFQLFYYQKGLEVWGNPLDFDTIISGLENELAAIKWQVYPNPVASSCIVELPLGLGTGNVAQQLNQAAPSAVLLISAMDGSLLQETSLAAQNLATAGGTVQIQLDLHELPAGIYLLSLTYNGFTVSKKLVKL